MCHQLAVGHHYYDLEPIQNVVFSLSLYCIVVRMTFNWVFSTFFFVLVAGSKLCDTRRSWYIIYNKVFWLLEPDHIADISPCAISVRPAESAAVMTVAHIETVET